MINQGHEITGKTALLLGAGGAARAIATALCAHGIRELKILNRTHENATALVSALEDKGGFEQAYAVTSHDGSDVDIVINATSMGLHDGDVAAAAGHGGRQYVDR